MKKLLVIAVLVAMVAGLVSVTGVSAEGPPSPPAPFETEDAVLVTVCEDVVLEWRVLGVPPNNVIPLKYIDTKGYNKFKLYAYMKPVEDTDFADVNASYLRISLAECATPDPEKFAYQYRGTNPDTDWIKWDPMPPTPPHFIRPGYYSMVFPIQEGIYSVFGVGGSYIGPPPPAPPPPPQPTITVSVYLLMAK